MERSEFLCAKRAHQLSRNQIPEIIMDWIRYTPQQALAGPQPDQEVMSRVFGARCNANGEV